MQPAEWRKTSFEIGAYDAFPRIGGSATLSVTGHAQGGEAVMVQVCATGISNAS